jgi:hypothetical protein
VATDQENVEGTKGRGVSGGDDNAANLTQEGVLAISEKLVKENEGIGSFYNCCSCQF